ncbi:MAG: CBS domain-containing protein [Paenibacillaceae bacterium]
MKAHEIMVTEVYKVNEKDTIRSIIEKFVDQRISGLPVVNDKNEIVAFVSDGDIMRYIGKHKDTIFDTFYFVSLVKGDDDEFEERVQKILDLNVMTIAQKKVHKVKWNEEVEDIAAILGEKQIKKLPVERDGVLVGIISRGDVIRTTFKGLL